VTLGEDFIRVTTFDGIHDVETKVVDLCEASHKSTYVELTIMWRALAREPATPSEARDACDDIARHN
jgi:hypothetical protein